MIKYASNALLATAISFTNEVANLCSALGSVDVVDVMEGVHASSYLTVTTGPGERIKAPITSFFGAGCGFGGSCLPKDVKALATHGQDQGLPMSMLRAVMSVNEAQPEQITRLLEKHFPSLTGVRIALLGLAFKPDTDDVRESPAFPIVRALRARGAQIKAYDPVAMAEARKILGDEVRYVESLAKCLDDIDAVVLVTRWKEFEAVPALLASRTPPPVVVDGRRLLDKRLLPRYAGIGL
jgi:UDPglucose 6-dehydrogenase/GDP-mannose 6-dehydrogenase